MMDSYRDRKPGSVRLNDEQYEEMELLGLENESQYLRYKLNQSTAPMQVNRGSNELDDISDKLALQRAELENQRLREKLDDISKSQQETLNGVNTHVSQLLQEELMKRDFEALKKENAQQSKQIEKLETTLKKAEEDVEDKDDEIRELMRKLGVIELGKTLLPGAISGLAKRYPKQLQGLAETLGELGGQMATLPPHSEGLSEEQEQLIAFAEYFQELFNDDQLQDIVTLLGLVSQGLKTDPTIIQKMTYYINRLLKVNKSKENNIEQESIKNETI